MSEENTITLDQLWNEQFEKFIVGESAYGYGNGCGGEAGGFGAGGTGSGGDRSGPGGAPCGGGLEKGGSSTLGKMSEGTVKNIKEFDKTAGGAIKEVNRGPYTPADSPYDPLFPPMRPIPYNPERDYPDMRHFRPGPKGQESGGVITNVDYPFDVGINVGIQVTLRPTDNEYTQWDGDITIGSDIEDNIKGAITAAVVTLRKPYEDKEDCEPEPDPNGGTDPNPKPTPGTGGLPNDPTPTPVNPVRPGGPINIGGGSGGGVISKPLLPRLGIRP